jgi:Protein of unknown function (DUF3465)
MPSRRADSAGAGRRLPGARLGAAAVTMPQRRPLLRLLPVAFALLASAVVWIYACPPSPAEAPPTGSPSSELRPGEMVEVTGRVSRILSDDREGSRHQRFVLTLDDGATLLVAHNIDLAPRVPLEVGDRARVRGRYEWNERGGVVHWTHHDPSGSRRAAGWIEHRGKVYD